MRRPATRSQPHRTFARSSLLTISTSSATPLAARSSISQQHPRLHSQLPPLHRIRLRSRLVVDTRTTLIDSVHGAVLTIAATFAPPFVAHSRSTHRDPSRGSLLTLEKPSAPPLVIKCSPSQHHPRLRSRLVALTLDSALGSYVAATMPPRRRSLLAASNRSPFPTPLVARCS